LWHSGTRSEKYFRYKFSLDVFEAEALERMEVPHNHSSATSKFLKKAAGRQLAGTLFPAGR